MDEECLHLLAEIKELKEANNLLTEQLSQCREEAANALQKSDGKTLCKSNMLF